MSQTCFHKQEEETYTPDEQKAFVRSGFHCQICNARGSLVCHTCTDENPQPHDVLVLCKDCHRLAQRRKRNRAQKKWVRLLQLAYLACLLLLLAIIIATLSSLLPHSLFLLCVAAIYVAYLIEMLSNRWL